jgi:hypothetical protein
MVLRVVVGLSGSVSRRLHIYPFRYMLWPMEKPLVWLHGEEKTPPFSKEARLEAGFLLRRLQRERCSPCPSPGRCPA